MKIVGIHGRETYLVSMTAGEIHTLMGFPGGYGCERVADDYGRAMVDCVGRELEIDTRWGLIHKFASSPKEVELLANNLEALSTMVRTAKTLGEKLMKEEENHAATNPAV